MGRISQSAERTVVRASATEIPQVFRDPLPLGGTGKILQQQLIEELRGGDYFWFALLLLSGIGSAGAWLRHYFNRDEREENTSHRNRILAMVSRVHTAESNQELLAMQREVDAIIGETLECYDDGAIEEEELAAFGLVLELFNHAIGARRVALQASTLEPARVAAVGSSLTSRR